MCFYLMCYLRSKHSVTANITIAIIPEIRKITATHKAVSSLLQANSYIANGARILLNRLYYC